MSSRVYYNKLVRDGIEDKIKAKGELYELRTVVDDTEFQQELLKKIAEEAAELSRTRQRKDFLAEYADLMVVLDTLTKELEISEAELRIALEENVKQKGGYAKKQFLLWSEDVGYTSNESPQGIHEKSN